MGWDGTIPTHYKNGKVDKKAEVRSCFVDSIEIIKDTFVGSVYYGAAKNVKTGEVFAVVVPTRMQDGWFWTKMMDETVGPCECDCPKSILNLLTPTDCEWANEWREKCRTKADRPKLKDLAYGTIIRFDKDKYAECMPPSYQFKTRWFIALDKQGNSLHKYYSKRDIPFDFEIVGSRI